MEGTRFRGKLLADCTLEDLHDARAWAEDASQPLFDPSGAQIPRAEAKHLYEGALRQIEEELAARKRGLAGAPAPEDKA